MAPWPHARLASRRSSGRRAGGAVTGGGEGVGHSFTLAVHLNQGGSLAKLEKQNDPYYRRSSLRPGQEL